MRNVLTSKITVPTLDTTFIPRKVLQHKMSGIVDYPITIITAGAGYGKTMSLVRFLLEKNLAAGWYNMGPEDDNLYLFSVYLATTLDSFFPGLKKWYCNTITGEQLLDWKTLFYNLMTGIEQFATHDNKGYLVIDDWQYGQADKEISNFFNRILAEIMDKVHVILLSREYVSLSTVEKARISGRVLDLCQQDFLFDTQEIKSLFSQEGISSINKTAINAVLSKTEGWAIAVKLLARQCRHEGKLFWDKLALGNLDSEGLFAYLTQDVFDSQPPEVQVFAMKASLVENFDISYCREIIGIDKSKQWYGSLARRGLFLTQIGETTYRFHSLFRNFLQQKAEELLPDLEELYGRIGTFYEQQHAYEKALPFLFKGKHWRKVAKLLSEVGPRWVLSGRQKLFNFYLQKLPEQYQKQPAIYLARGHMERITNNYDQAVQWYKKAARTYKDVQDQLGQSHSYRSLGELYLDIIQPGQTQKYLRQAYKLLASEQLSEKAALLYLMSENMINYGNPKRAEWYFGLWQRAKDFKDIDQNNIQARIYLRTGRINEAIRLLEKQPEDKDRLPRSFRESSLILALCYAFQGEVEKAADNALNGITYGNKIQSSFAQIIGHTRLGHALLTDYHKQKELCRNSYAKALELAEQLEVERGKTEIYWGRCLISGLEKNWTQAQQEGLYALSITEKGHDIWFAAELYLSLALTACLCQKYEKGKEYAKIALSYFEKCRDTLGQAAALWQMCKAYAGLNRVGSFKPVYEKLVSFCQQYGYQYLLTKKTFLADLTGGGSNQLAEYYQQIASTKKKQKKTGCGQEMYIQTLGGLRILRGGEEILSKDWKRKAAKQLFFLLITKRFHPVAKEEFMEALWPEADSRSAQGNFKVVLNYLSQFLEPDRKAREESKFIIKSDTSLQLNLNKNFQIDVQKFEQLLTEGIRCSKSNPSEAEILLTDSLNLYQGEYLAGEYLDDFSLRERERLQVMAIKGAETLAELLINDKQYDKAIIWCDKILGVDNAWEKAYQLKIICYGEVKRTALVEKVYRNCITNLQNELGIGISYSTENIYKKYS